MDKRLNMAMIGGGLGSLIGPVHWRAAIMFNQAQLVAGVFSSDRNKSQESAALYHLPPERGFGSIQELIAWDKQRPSSERIDFFTICTPNFLHCRDAKVALENGYHVICDKPLAHDLAEAEEFARFVQGTDRVFALTHNYTGYPIIRQLRNQIARGELGDILVVRLRYIQGWLATPLEQQDHKQAKWRTDPKKSGESGCFADIGTHAYNLMRFTTDLRPKKISAHLQSIIPGRSLDDYGQATLIMENNAMAHITASQISHGYRNHFTLEIDGNKASASWCQENPELLTIRRNHSADECIHRAQVASDELYVRNASSLPAGHPEGYLAAFANIYKDAFTAIRAINSGQRVDRSTYPFPDIHDGLDGMRFIHQSVSSSKQNNAWLNF